jgi:hypothetical protein
VELSAAAMPASTRRLEAPSSSCRRASHIDEPNIDEDMTAVNTRRKRKASPGSGNTRSTAAATVETVGAPTSDGSYHGEQMKQSTSNTRGVETPKPPTGDARSTRSFSSSSSRSHRSSSQERNGQITESSGATPRSHGHLLSPSPYDNKVRYPASNYMIDWLLKRSRSVVSHVHCGSKSRHQLGTSVLVVIASSLDGER